MKSGMFCEVESHEKITRCRLQSGNSEVEIGEQREAAKLEDSGGRERMLGRRRLEGKARLLEWRRMVSGESVKLEEAVDCWVNMVRWR